MAGDDAKHASFYSVLASRAALREAFFPAVYAAVLFLCAALWPSKQFDSFVAKFYPRACLDSVPRRPQASSEKPAVCQCVTVKKLHTILQRSNLARLTHRWLQPPICPVIRLAYLRMGDDRN
jgi:hypothetical protein